RFVPVVEQAVAAADRRAVAPRRPRESDARHQVETAADVRLQLIPHADAEREPVVQPDVVRPVEAHVVLRERGVHLAKALGKRDGPVLVEGLKRRVGVGTSRISRVEVLVASALDDIADTPLLFAPDVETEFPGYLDGPVRATARDTGAALREGVEHDDRWRLRERR